MLPMMIVLRDVVYAGAGVLILAFAIIVTAIVRGEDRQ